MNKTRIDSYMVEKGFAPSRTKAQELIKSGLVSIRFNMNTRLIKQASTLIDNTGSTEIIIQKNILEKYVSRAGVKMELALNFLKLDVENFSILDIGISTGGFSDCLLQFGASSVLGVDVGHNQLSPKLKSDPRIKLLEGINARELESHPEIIKNKPIGGFDLVVIDVSFISLTLILPSAVQLVKEKYGRILALVKPQFEVGKEGLSKNGIVKDENLYGHVQYKIENEINKLGKKTIEYFESGLEGKDGNKEFFCYIG